LQPHCFRVIDRDLPEFASCFLIQRDQVGVARAEEHLSIGNGDTAIEDEAVGMSVRRQGWGLRIFVMPDHTTRSPVEGENLKLRRNQVHDASHNDRRCLEVIGVVASLEDPGREELLHVRGIDLIKRAVAPGELSAAVMGPVGVSSTSLLRPSRRCRRQ
jgi:hypothetical protein